ncbi:ABC transporter ATP-binding protein [Lactobacillus sp. ESL0791]|uniref:ATP-binding cassette domain-containing protein n=1 Tax=Lactobacillus sp. ESL0791 TaxID=2983234 RepID=UPI0023F69200|nr:ABC transporter ATP-binding protein [Lactobacillus sp. ESL0791]MDF7639889.1 ABC transporter ATP-binding protein [Lactobacillus sp. ESL0791]
MGKYSIISNLRWLISYMGKEKKWLCSWPVAVTVIKVVNTLLTATLPAFVVWAFTDKSRYKITLPLLVLVSLLSGFLSWFSNWYNRKMFWENTKLRWHLSLKDDELYLQQPFADSLSHVKQDERFAATQYAFSDENTGVSNFISSLANFTATLVTLIVISLLTIKISWLVFCLIWLSMLLTDYLLQQLAVKRRHFRKKIDEQQYAREYYNKICFAENASADIRLYNLAPGITAKIEAIQAQVESSEQQISQVKVNYQNLIQVISFLRFAVSFCCLLLALKNGRLNITEFTFYFGLLSSVELLLRNNCQNFMDLTAANSDINSGRKYFSKVEQTITKQNEQMRALPTKFNIKFDHVNFGYQPDKLIIKDFTLEIKQGQQLALVGLNGAGKTTLTLLLMGYLQPLSGEIYVGNCPLSELSNKQRLSFFSAMFQENTVLATDVLHNITVNRAASATKVEQLLVQTKFAEKVAHLKAGLKTQLTHYVSDDGQNFSGGELEKLMLTRALYKNAPIMILDEPTAALDALAEKDLYQQIASLTKGKTTIFISHRLASTATSDQVCFMKAGQIIGLGSHEELLRTNQAYRNLYDSQAKYYREEQHER